jgi:hypothetical protein
MKKLVQSVVLAAAVGLLVGIWLECAANPLHRPTWPSQSRDQLSAKLTEQFLNQLSACAIH